MPAEQLETIFKVLEGGAEVAADNIVKFPVDAAGAAAETALSGEGVSTAVQFGNGLASEVSQLTVIEGGAGTATTTGLGLLGVDVGVAGAAIAPALGILAGVGLYNLAPEFWTNVSDKLVAAGQTVGGKVRAFLDGNSKQTAFSEETIEIFKQAFWEAGLFDTRQGAQTLEPTTENPYNYDIYNLPFTLMNPYTMHGFYDKWNTLRTFQCTQSIGEVYCLALLQTNDYMHLLYYSLNDFTITHTDLPPGAVFNTGSFKDSFGTEYKWAQYGNPYWDTDVDINIILNYYNTNYWFPNEHVEIPYLLFQGTTSGTNDSLQPDAVYPEQETPFPQTYPEWQPLTAPEAVPWPQELPNLYPVELPVNNPDAVQEEAQNPNPDPDPAPWLDWLLDNLPVPDPIIDPNPQPVPQPDPDPQPEPEPLPDPAEDETDENPINPNPDPTPSPIPYIPPIPATVDSNKLFTVYNPSLSQLNALGGYLWSADIIDQLVKMWQNPLDGIISLQKVYATPTTGGSKNIILGYLDSGVSAPVVTQQFQTIQCGTVEVKENKRNATDYTPYVDLHLYLPFIGFVELDPDEFMNGTLTVIYKVDMYTGTCLADVKATRSADMPNATSLYQFSGNASQQIPLTAGTANGLISSLVSVVGAGIAVASGGAVGAAGAAISMGHSLTHEMLHVGHSGSLSANAGIMGSRRPAIIIGRRHSYDANAYNEMYGYPANKTVFLGNCSGFTRIKAGRLQSKATEKEKDEIMELLKKGVIL